MNEEIQKKLVENASNLLDAVNSATSFVAGEAPLYVQELLNWMVWDNSLDLAVCLFLTAVGFCLLGFARFSYKKAKHDDDWFTGVIFGCLLGTAVTVASMCMSVKAVGNIIKIKVAPRVVIVEHLRGIIK